VAYAWVLNLDADLELARGTPGYTPTRAVLGAMKTHATRLAATLLAPDDIVAADGNARGFVGRAFCPTPRAIALLERAGATIEPHPALAVLRAVNGRAFSASLGQTLPGARFCTSRDAITDVLAAPPPVGRGWRAKRAFGMAGRGQRPIDAPTAGDEAFFASALAEGGLQLEPNVRIVRELGQHGLLAADGRLALGAPVVQTCDALGQWIASTPAPDEEHAATLADEARRVASALHVAGYFGPFGVDAFVYEVGVGGAQLILNPRSEINARYSMGFAMGFARPLSNVVSMAIGG